MHLRIIQIYYNIYKKNQILFPLISLIAMKINSFFLKVITDFFFEVDFFRNVSLNTYFSIALKNKISIETKMNIYVIFHLPSKKALKL